MPDITKIKIGNERERSYKDFPANREFKKRAEDDNPGGGGWPADLPKPSVGGYGYTEQGEQVLYDGNLLIEDPVGGAFYSMIEIDALEVGETYKVIWNGDEYVCDCVESDGEVYLGNASIIGSPITNDYPFVFVNNKMTVDVATSTSGTYSIKLSKNADTVHKIDEKYLPEAGGAMVVEFTVNAREHAIESATKTVEEVKNAMMVMPVVGVIKVKDSEAIYPIGCATINMSGDPVFIIYDTIKYAWVLQIYVKNGEWKLSVPS